MENLIPVRELESNLRRYALLYHYVTASQDSFRFLCKKAKSSLMYLIYMPILILVGVITFLYAAGYLTPDVNDFFAFVGAFGGIFLIVVFACRVLTFESAMGGRRMIRLGFYFHTKNLIVSCKQISRLKVLAQITTPTMKLILSGGKNEDKAIEKHLYTFGQGKIWNSEIAQYNRTYKEYRDFVNFDKHWSIASMLYDYVRSGRVSSGGEALQYYDLQKHREKMEYEVQRQKEIAQELLQAEQEKISEYKKTKQAAKEYTAAIKKLENTINENGGISSEDVDDLEKAINTATENLEGR